MKPYYIKVAALTLIPCLGIIVYSNTFRCPFQFDDLSSIIGNPFIKDIHNLQNIWDFLPRRFILYLSIALNYHFNGLNVWGYHLFNLGVHLISAILVWRLALLTFSTPVMKGKPISRHADTISLFAGLIFVSHPIQTQAVTYIVQRAASMATMFYLLSLCFYVASRLRQRKTYYICSLAAAVAAMFTKETAITLPLMILLYEISFLEINGDVYQLLIGRRHHLFWKRVAPFLLTLIIIPLTILLTESVKARQMRGIAPDDPSGISSMHYLLTQFRVMATYVRLVFLPFNQNVDYDYPVFKNILELPVLTSFLFLAAILFSAVRLFSKYRLVSFSIFWFFLTLLPESSLLPLHDVIFEHRLYLPLAGFSLFLASGMYYLGGKNKFKTTVKVMVLIIGCYSILTYQRNKVWRDEITLLDDVIQKSPHKERPYNNRGLAWARRGNTAQALSDYSRAIDINPRYTNAYINRGFIYEQQGNFPLALSDDDRAIEINPQLTEAYINRGNVYAKEGDFTQALSDYGKAVEINPKDAGAYNDRGNIYFRLGNFTQAITDYKKAVDLKPDYEDAYYNLGLTYSKQGNCPAAAANYNKAIELNPEDTQAYKNRALC